MSEQEKAAANHADKMAERLVRLRELLPIAKLLRIVNDDSVLRFYLDDDDIVRLKMTRQEARELVKLLKEDA